MSDARKTMWYERMRDIFDDDEYKEAIWHVIENVPRCPTMADVMTAREKCIYSDAKIAE